MEPIVLAGDIGGTKIHLGLFRVDRERSQMVRDQIFATRDCENLEAAIGRFLNPDEKVVAGCFGVAGPVIDGVSHPVNIPWEIAETSISRSLNGRPVRLLNDLEATAWGTLHLSDTDTVTLLEGTARAQGTVAIIAAGTGLGEAGRVHTRAGWHVIACEGGHADFAPRDHEQIELLEYLANEFGHVSFERVLSGPGLHNIYRFLRTKSPDEPRWLADQMQKTDASAVISETALAGKDPVCVHALEVFAEIYAAEAANLALKYLALGGVFICGGIAPKILPFLKTGRFMRAFLDKGRLRPTLEQIPVRVSVNENTALLGAAHVAAAMAGESNSRS